MAIVGTNWQQQKKEVRLVYLDKKQASEKMGISTRTFDRIRKDGKISTYALSPRNLRFDSDELDAYIRNSEDT